MRLSRLIAIVAAAVVLQFALARYAVGDRVTFDLVLVAVVFVALPGGPVAGMLAGTLGGLAVDAVGGGLIGTSALLKTVIGFLSGLLGNRLVVARAHGRAALVAAATVVHALMRVGLVAVIDQRWPGLPAADMLGELLVNTICGFAAFAVADGLPGAVARGRQARRSSLERRQW